MPRCCFRFFAAAPLRARARVCREEKRRREEREREQQQKRPWRKLATDKWQFRPAAKQTFAAPFKQQNGKLPFATALLQLVAAPAFSITVTINRHAAASSKETPSVGAGTQPILSFPSSEVRSAKAAASNRTSDRAGERKDGVEQPSSPSKTATATRRIDHSFSSSFLGKNCRTAVSLRRRARRRRRRRSQSRVDLNRSNPPPRRTDRRSKRASKATSRCDLR